MHIEDSLNKDARAARFSGDITRYALDREMDSSGCIFVAMVIVPMLEPVLQCQVGMTVAHAFGDALNFQSLKKQAHTLLNTFKLAETHAKSEVAAVRKTRTGARFGRREACFGS